MKAKIFFRRFILLLLSLFVTAGSILFGQSVDTSLLCRGQYFTEAQGKQVLNNFAKNYFNRSTWEKKASRIRQGIIEGAGLDLVPKGTPLKPIIHSKRAYDGYTVENVAFESLPGFFVTGNLYRPTETKTSYPAILSPHGHGSESPRFSESVQKRAASLARMGAIVLTYDMIGFGESDQCSHTHPRGVTLQTNNSIRAVDFLLSLPDVDSTRIAVTGESGGGTQSFLLTAVDDRIAVSVPVVMVSAHFFGGCTCESGMPIHRSKDHQTNNVEIAALAAPRPMLLISDGKDWTKNTPQVEFPHIRNIYRFYGKDSLVKNVHFPTEGHDYGINKRKAAYNFLANHLGLSIGKITNSSGEIDESFVTIETRQAMQVFDATHPRPNYAVAGDQAVSNLLIEKLIHGRSY
jgi:dienelactone hydrolase